VIEQAVMVSTMSSASGAWTSSACAPWSSPRLPDLDPAKIIINTTHTHTAPVLVDAREENPHAYDLMATFVYRVPEQGVMQPRAYVELFAARVADAVVEAWKTRLPRGVSWALSYAVIGHNRRAHYSTGRSQMYGPTTSRSSTGSRARPIPAWS